MREIERIRAVFGVFMEWPFKAEGVMASQPD
jgi:hypothetical protein